MTTASKLALLDPSREGIVPSTYNAGSITKKNANKEFLLGQLGLPKKKVLLVAIVITTPWETLTKAQQQLIETLVFGMQQLDYLQPLLLFSKEQKEEVSGFTEVHKFTVQSNGVIDQTLLAGADLFLFPEKEPQKLEAYAFQILRFGGIVSLYKKASSPNFLEAYNPYTESGSAFLYQKHDVWNIFAEMVRVFEVYKFSFDWNTIRRRAMGAVYS